MSPKLSIIMSCRNHQDLVAKSVLSVLNQTFSDFEFLIFDDFSIDCTYDVLYDLAKQDKRIRLFRNNSVNGLTKNLNDLLQLCRSDIIGRQDADDTSVSTRFEEFLQNYDPSINLYTSNFYLEQEKNILTTNQSGDPSFVLFNFLFYFYFGSHGQIFFNKQFYDKKFRYCQDYEFCSNILRSNFKDFKLIKSPLYVYKRHENTIFKRHRKKQIYFSLITAKHNLNYFLNININNDLLFQLRNMFLDNKKPKNNKNIILPVLNHIKNSFFNKLHLSKNEQNNINILVNSIIKNSYEK